MSREPAIPDGLDGISPPWLSETLRQDGVIDAAVATDVRAEAMAVRVGFASVALPVSRSRMTCPTAVRPARSSPSTLPLMRPHAPY